MSESRPKTVYEFGAFRLIPGNGLFESGQPVHLPPKELATLTLLVERHGEVVSQAEFFSTVWPGDPVSNESLTRCIYVLRRLFTSRRLPYLETLHRRGYRFAAEVRKVEEPATSTQDAARGLNFADLCLEAREALAQGWSRVQLRHPGDLQQAIGCFERAVQLEPKFIGGHLGLANALRLLLLRPGEHAPVARKQFQAAVSGALAIDPERSEARGFEAWYQAIFDWDWDAGQATLDRLVAAHPEAYILRSDRAYVLLCRGQAVPAIEEFRQVLERNPFLVETNLCLTLALASTGQIPAAVEHARAAAERLPSFSVISAAYAYAASLMGAHDEAIAAARRAVLLSDHDPLERATLVPVLHRAGQIDAATAEYRDLLIKQIWVPSYMAPAALCIEGPQACLDWLEKAYQAQCYLLPVMLLDVRLAGLRSLPRFESVEKAVRGGKHLAGKPHFASHSHESGKASADDVC